MIDIHHGDCLDVLRTMPDDSVDSVCTDPPYGLSNHGDISAALTAWLSGEVYQHSKRGFMGKDWDGFVPGPEVWREVLRVLKPGGHALVFAGTRTVDLMGIALRLAGFEVRDSLVYWGYATGFPKGHDISKAIDRMAGADREVVGQAVTGAAYTRAERRNADEGFESGTVLRTVTAPATPEAQQWDGWNTALKPAHEPILLVRKPLSEPTIAANVLVWGTGGLNIDGCRIATDELTPRNNKPGPNGWKNSSGGYVEPSPLGRWPANVLLDEHAAAELDRQSGERKSTVRPPSAIAPTGNGFTHGAMNPLATERGFTDSGGASRFFFVAKASRKERNAGLEGMPERESWAQKHSFSSDPRMDHEQARRPQSNTHPTVKPLTLMRYLVKLITPPGGVVLDPFAGSGTTGMACVHEDFDAILIEREAEYVEIARKRVAAVVAQREMEIV
jgi:DNA modification methylase